MLTHHIRDYYCLDHDSKSVENVDANILLLCVTLSPILASAFWTTFVKKFDGAQKTGGWHKPCHYVAPE